MKTFHKHYFDTFHLGNTQLITIRSRVLLENLIVSQLVKKSSHFMKHRRFINTFIRASQINPDYAPIPLREDYFHCVPPTKGLFRVGSFFEWPVTLYIFKSRRRYHLIYIPSWKTTLFRHSQLPSLLENVPASAD
jgi:hypothetical protein